MDWEGEARKYQDDPVEPARKYTPDDADKERCVICLMALRDRTIVGVCGHEFCVSASQPSYLLDTQTRWWAEVILELMSV